MTGRRKQILAQKLIGLLILLVSIGLMLINDGDDTILLIPSFMGFVLIFCRQTIGEIIQEETAKEIEEILKEREDL